MYQVSDSVSLVRAQRQLLTRHRSGISRTVVLLGLTSLLTDISSEMVVTVLPLYLVYVGGFSPLAYGVIDGIYQGATAIAGLASGYIGDRWRRHKSVAATGYGVSAVCKLGLATVGTALSAIGAVVLLDRAGKGIRTAPRDAMISLSSEPRNLGIAFGVHRAMDTTGALLGPLVAFALLSAAPFAFHSLFLLSFCIAAAGFAVLVLLVDDRRQEREAQAPERRPSLRGALALLRIARYRALLVAGGALSLATASDAFIFLALQRKLELGNSMFPLLFVGSSATYMLLAVPMGRLADRIGRGRVMLAGYAMLIGVYAALVTPLGGWLLVALALVLLGAYYGASDGVLMAFVSGIVPSEVRGTGLALVQTTTSLGRLLASVLFGALWTLWSIDTALACFGAMLAAAVLLSAFALRRSRIPA